MTIHYSKEHLEGRLFMLRAAEKTVANEIKQTMEILARAEKPGYFLGFLKCKTWQKEDKP